MHEIARRAASAWVRALLGERPRSVARTLSTHMHCARPPKHSAAAAAVRSQQHHVFVVLGAARGTQRARGWECFRHRSRRAAHLACDDEMREKMERAQQRASEVPPPLV